MYQSLFNLDGRDEAIKLIDFSTARQLKNKDAYLFDCAGTLGFRAPE
jgi:serine/threonine protein kinase